jgi:hypothetical protein
MLKKMVAAIFILTFLASLFSSSIYASEGLIKPTSSLYFLQTWLENVQISLRFSNAQKLEYLFTLTDKRVEEMKDSTTPAVIRLYEKHYQYLDRLASLMENKEEVTARIEANSLRQQAVLAGVYIKAPEEAKDAIVSAQENSSKHVARTIERVEGPQRAQEYIGRVETIQKLEKMGQAELIEQLPMEGSPNANPSEAAPKEIKGTNPLLPGQDLNTINAGQDGGQGMEPAGQIEMNAPAGQN